jgi:formylglycine-generating enzyme required for sulfatase activity
MKGQERHIVSVQDRINALEAKSVRYREEDISSGAESLPFRVGTKSANQWGLEDMWGNVNELLMDRLSPRVPLPSWGIATIPSEFLDWNGKNRDPLFWDSSANANGSVMQATRWGWGRRFAWRRDRGGWMGFRLCVGPDLLKERGITPPKLGK